MPTPMDVFRFWVAGNSWLWNMVFESAARNNQVLVDTAFQIFDIQDNMTRRMFGLDPAPGISLTPAERIALRSRKEELLKKRFQAVG